MKLNIIDYKTTILQAVVLVISYIIIGLAVPTMMNTMLFRPFWNKFSVWMNIAAITVLSILFFIGAAKRTGYKVEIFNNITIMGVLSAIGCSIFFYLLLDKLLDPILDKAFPASAVDYKETLEALRQSTQTTFIRICLIAPITEEILMRGYVLTGLNNKYGAVIALLISTILFAVLHFNFVQTLSAVICGLVIGLLYMNTGSLFCCILAHALYNSISFYFEIVKNG